MINEQPLFDLLHKLDIKAETYRHEPVFTVEQAYQIKCDIPGSHTKNLYLKDKKKRYWLITLLAERTIRLNDLAKLLGTQRLHFASPEELECVLQVKPGSVTPFALMHETARDVSFVLDAAIVLHDYAGFHPLHNAATTVIKTGDLVRFTDHVLPLWHTVDFSAMTVIKRGTDLYG